MESLIPLNGRIAIVDDQIEQALPLMRVFAKNNIPYVYYKGNDIEYLPEQPENDIRILLLDLNLLGGRDNQPKDIRSSLFSSNPQPPSKDDTEVKKGSGTDKRGRNVTKIGTKTHKIPLPHNAT